jgi:hypothetical protein
VHKSNRGYPLVRCPKAPAVDTREEADTVVRPSQLVSFTAGLIETDEIDLNRRFALAPPSPETPALPPSSPPSPSGGFAAGCPHPPPGCSAPAPRAAPRLLRCLQRGGPHTPATAAAQPPGALTALFTRVRRSPSSHASVSTLPRTSGSHRRQRRAEAVVGQRRIYGRRRGGSVR